MFEAHLKELYPTSPKINYEIKDLFNFIDRLGKKGGSTPPKHSLIKFVALLRCPRPLSLRYIAAPPSS
jgi:hypothetical protein